LERDGVDPASVTAPPAPPEGGMPPGEGFLVALAEAARTAGRDVRGRAAGRILLRGSDGAVVGTDGRQLLIQAGFTLPCKADLLIPALPAFTCRELQDSTPVLLGRAQESITLQAGPWSLLMRAEAARGYPNVNAVIPSPEKARTRLVLDPEDAS